MPPGPDAHEAQSHSSPRRGADAHAAHSHTPAPGGADAHRTHAYRVCLCGHTLVQPTVTLRPQGGGGGDLLQPLTGPQSLPGPGDFVPGVRFGPLLVQRVHDTSPRPSTIKLQTHDTFTPWRATPGEPTPCSIGNVGSDPTKTENSWNWRVRGKPSALIGGGEGTLLPRRDTT